jgi:hypothetical protein
MLSREEEERYDRQLRIGDFGKAGQEKLKSSKVFISGLGGLGSIGFHDIRKLYKEDFSTLKSPDEWDEETAAAVGGLEVFEEFAGRGEDRIQIGTTKKVRVFGKVRALDLLAKHLKLLGPEGEGTKVAVVILEAGPVKMPSTSGLGEEG